jgi:hypothetical protein
MERPPTSLPRRGLRRWIHTGIATCLGLLIASPAAAQERLCDNSFEDCRAAIVDMIRAERVGIDVSMWFMTDWRYSTEIIRRWQAGVPVRILLDLRADTNYPANTTIRQNLVDAGIPIRHKTTTGINHWKMMLYAGQGKLHFTAGKESFNPCAPPAPFVSACGPTGLTPGTTYYWMIRGKTMLGDVRRISGPVWSFMTAGAPPLPPPPPPSTTTGSIVADAYVRGGQYASTNFGATAELVTKFSTDESFRREAFLTLDIAAVQPGDQVRLRLFGRLSDTRASSVTVAINKVPDTSWIETAISWNTRPAAETTEWARVTVAGTTGQWYEIDLTSRLQAERLAGRTTVAIVLRKSVDSLPYVAFASRESASPPSLVTRTP